ncbi:MAG: hypothetical protein PUG67_08985 [Peptoniphilaceae bacterium]|nr:hypothetical protein [Peptoniphilaceae bacterium]MDY6018544.1 hypothetical protein [Anaerococcus sp.]
MKLNKKYLSLSLAILIAMGGLSACNSKKNTTNVESGSSKEMIPVSSQSSKSSLQESSKEDNENNTDKDYESMTKEEKISYLEDKIFEIRVKARSLEMKLEENPQYSDSEKEKVQNSLDETDQLIEKLNKEVDKLKNE